MSSELRGARFQKIRAQRRTQVPSSVEDEYKAQEFPVDEADDSGTASPVKNPAYHGRAGAVPTVPKPQNSPSLDPYIAKLERYELFCTNQSYYLVGCNRHNTAYRVLKMDRTLIERPPESHSTGSLLKASKLHSQPQHQPNQVNPSASNVSSNSTENTSTAPLPSTATETAHTSKPTLRPLSDFLSEDPNVYSQDEIQDMLDMIHDGNRMQREDGAGGDGAGPGGVGGDGGLKPICKAYGIVGFIRYVI